MTAIVPEGAAAPDEAPGTPPPEEEEEGAGADAHRPAAEEEEGADVEAQQPATPAGAPSEPRTPRGTPLSLLKGGLSRKGSSKVKKETALSKLIAKVKFTEE